MLEQIYRGEYFGRKQNLSLYIFLKAKKKRSIFLPLLGFAKIIKIYNIGKPHAHTHIYK